MEKDFVPYEPSLALKELGFDGPCFKQWTYAPELIFCTTAWGLPKLKTNQESYSDSGGDCISAPTFSQAFRFFREKYGLYHSILHFEHNTGTSKEFLGEVIGKLTHKDDDMDLFSWHMIYEEAELACLIKLIEIVKENKQ